MKDEMEDISESFYKTHGNGQYRQGDGENDYP